MKRIGSAARCCAAIACALLLACGSADEDDYMEEPVPMPDPTPVQYPVDLWDKGITGETEVLVHVNEYGDVDSAMVARTSGYAEFDSAAVGGARQLRFTPGRRGDRPVPMWTKIPVRFAQDSTASFGAPTATGLRETGQ